MFQATTILHPSDFSEPAAYAFRVAAALATDQNARLLVLHVVSPQRYDEVATPLVPEDYQDKLWASFRALQKTDPRIRELRLETEVAEGDPAREILRVAEEHECDLIVMGTHGRTGLRRLLMGSVAEEVLRHASCPVMTVKPPEEEHGTHKHKRDVIVI